MSALFIVGVTVTSLTILVNLIGLKVLHEVRNIRSMQRVLLTNLSLSETLNTIIALASLIVLNHGKLIVSDSLVFNVLAGLSVVMSCAALIIITMDRVIATTWPLKYTSLVTKPRLIKAIVIAWICCFALVGTMTVLTMDSIHSYMFLITSPTEVIIFTSYMVILIKTNKSKHRSAGAGSRITETRQGRKILMMSSCIVASFACLVAIPDLLIYFHSQYIEIHLLAIQGYYFINPIIYIYCYPPLRAHLSRKVQALRSSMCKNKETNRTDKNNMKMERLDVEIMVFGRDRKDSTSHIINEACEDVNMD